MELISKLLRGMVIGLANIIPGVSGGTMMVSMGIYDTLIHCITHLFTEFKKSIITLLPYAVGMVAAIVGLSFTLKWAFAHYALPANTLFIGLILGGLPAILQQLKGHKKGVVGCTLFAAFFVAIAILQLFQAENSAVISLSFVEIIKLFFIGMLASATMVIPGVSGSMLLKLLGYYEPVVTQAIPGLVTALTHGNWTVAGANVGILLPFGVGVVLGIFIVAKIIEVLLAKWKGQTYCAILGLVAASPVAIIMSTDMSGITGLTVILSLITFAAGFFVAWKLSSKESEQ